MNILRKCQAHFRERLRKLRFRGNDGFLIKYAHANTILRLTDKKFIP